MKTKSLGLGDDLEKVFKKTGIKAIVDKVTKGIRKSLVGWVVGKPFI